ncbi:unnamed protein product [Caenorhabditis brenneri]
MAELLSNNPIVLRHCLLYEFLRLKSVGGLENESSSLFARYNDFCKVIGDDALKYSEFEFWFYRFVNGEFDLNYEQDKDKKIYELADMPLDVLGSIVEYLDIKERLALARTSRSFKAFVDDQKSFQKFFNFSIDIDSAEFSLEDMWITFDKREDDCYREPGTIFLQKGKLIKGVPHWKQAIRDLESFLKLPKLHFEVLDFDFYRGPTDDDTHDTLETLDEAAKELEIALESIQQFHVKELSIGARSLKPLLKILPHLKPGYLTTIEFYASVQEQCHLEELVKMEQWKQAKCIKKFRTLIDGFWPHLYHFEKLNFSLIGLSVEDIRQVKEFLLKPSNLKYCEIEFGNSCDMDIIRHEFGNAIRENPETSNYTFHLLIPNSMEYFEIECTLDRVYPFENYPHEIKITRKKK